jgi:hypothetical protein
MGQASEPDCPWRLLVGLGPADSHAHAASAEFQIGHVECDKLGAPERASEPEQQNCAITQALHVGVGQCDHEDDFCRP